MRRALLWRLFLGLSVLTLVGPPLARAFLPNAIEYAIKQWFNGAGKLVGFQIFESTAAPAVSGANDCRLYVDATSNSLMASCGTKAYTYLVGGSATTPCTQDVNGDMTCNTFITPNRTPNNAVRLYANAGDGTCATFGVAGQLTIFDKLGTGDIWCLCGGTTELVCWGGSMPTCSGGQHLYYNNTTSVWTCT